MTAVILGLDQSLTSSGIVIAKVSNNSYQLLHMKQVITKKQDELCWINDACIRAKQLSNEINKLISEYKITNLIYESPSLNSIGRSSRSLSVFLGAVLAVMPSSVLIGTITPSALKKFATGFGGANKTQMLKAIKSRNLMLFNSLNALTESKGKYDLCDAFWLTQFLKEQLTHA